MKQTLITLGLTALAVIIGLMVYNMFISGSSWFGHFESSNHYETLEDGSIIDTKTGMVVAA